MRIAFDISQTGRRKAGCGYYANALISSLLSHGELGPDQRFTLLTSCGDFFHDPLLALQPRRKARNVGYGPRLPLRSTATKFWNTASKSDELLANHHILHTNNFWCPPRRVPCKVIYTLHDVAVFRNPEWSTARNREGCQRGISNAVKHADHIVAVSQSTRDEFLNLFPGVDEHRVSVIHPGSRFDLAEYKEEPRAPRKLRKRQNLPFFLCVGTLEPRKNLTTLLRAYGIYRERGGERIQLVLGGGEGWLMEDFLKEYANSPWRQDVLVLGYVTNSELRWLYQNCLMFFYASLYEGFGLPILEAMAEGAAVAASDQTSMPEIVGQAGWLLNPNSAEPWAEAMERISTDGALRRTLSDACKARAHHFSWQRCAGEVLALYKTMA